MLSTGLVTADVDLDPLAEKAFVRFLHYTLLYIILSQPTGAAHTEGAGSYGPPLKGGVSI